MFCSSGFLFVESASGSCHGLLEVLLICKDLLLVRVLFLGLCPLDDDDRMTTFTTRATMAMTPWAVGSAAVAGWQDP